MQDTKKPRTLHAADAWLLSHASALISYAASDEAFAESLAAHVRERNWRPTEVPINERTSIYLWPKDRIAAIQNTHWLLAELDRKIDAIYARGILATYAMEHESPQDLVLGIVGVAIIGPTLGLIQKKKKQKSFLPVVIEEHWVQAHTPAQLTGLTLQLSHAIVASELRLAGGDAYRLHPDTAAWCLEEPLTKLYAANKTTFRKLRTETHNESLPHQTKGQLALALSPTVDNDFLGQFALTAVA